MMKRLRVFDYFALTPCVHFALEITGGSSRDLFTRDKTQTTHFDALTAFSSRALLLTHLLSTACRA
jgi:hypothetical protein